MPQRLLISLLLFVAFVAAQGPEGRNLGTVEGVVLNENNNPLSGAIVTCNASPSRYSRPPSATTDSKGRFVLERVPSDLPEVAVWAYKESAGYVNVGGAFYIGSEVDHAILKIEDGKTTHGVVLNATKGAHLNLKFIDQNGTSIDASFQLEFRRPDNPEYGYLETSTNKRDFTMLVPAVPFKFIVQAAGYKPWSSDLLSPKSGATLKLKVRLERN